MCSMINERATIAGGGKGPQGWFPVDYVSVGYDHPTFVMREHAITIDFANEQAGPGARVAVELTPDSARTLIASLQTALERGRDLD
jgi:hypothetical protein